MSETKLLAAKEYIIAKNYDLARIILKSIEDNPTATLWLKKLDELSPNSPKVSELSDSSLIEGIENDEMFKELLYRIYSYQQEDNIEHWNHALPRLIELLRASLSSHEISILRRVSFAISQIDWDRFSDKKSDADKFLFHSETISRLIALLNEEKPDDIAAQIRRIVAYTISGINSVEGDVGLLANPEKHFGWEPIRIYVKDIPKASSDLPEYAEEIIVECGDKILLRVRIFYGLNKEKKTKIAKISFPEDILVSIDPYNLNNGFELQVAIRVAFERIQLFAEKELDANEKRIQAEQDDLAMRTYLEDIAPFTDGDY